MDNKVINTVKFELELPDSCDFLTIRDFMKKVEESTKNIGGELVFKNHETRHGSFLDRNVSRENGEYCYKNICIRSDISISICGYHPVFLLGDKEGDNVVRKRTLLSDVDTLFLRKSSVAVECIINSPVNEKMQTIDEVISFIADRFLLPCCNKNNFTAKYGNNPECGHEIVVAIKTSDWEIIKSRLNNQSDLGNLVREKVIAKEIERIDGVNIG
jgi:hypothetical protein